MNKNAGCQCYDKWANFMVRYGYDITIQPVSNMPGIKDMYHISSDMETCHTALINGYMVEDINLLLKENPEAVGLAASGMWHALQLSGYE